MEGNGYVSVAFIRGIDSTDVFMSPLSYGVAPFSISREKTDGENLGDDAGSGETGRCL